MLLDIDLRGNEKKSIKELIKYCDGIEVSKINGKYSVKATKGKSIIEFSIETEEKYNSIEKMIYVHPFKKEIKNIEEITEYLILSSDEELRHKLKTIYCEDHLCPICRSKLSKAIYNIRKCKNKCYTIVVLSSEFRMYYNSFVFGEVHHSKTEREDIQEKIYVLNQLYDKINYWKENDRYLTKLLEGEN